MIKDIRPEKNALRASSLEWRKNLGRSEKQRMDFKIQNKFLTLWKFREVSTVLAYCSKPLEVDTFLIIERALAVGKKVAVPRCVPGTRDMDFYLIHLLAFVINILK